MRKAETPQRHRLISVTLDEASIGRAAPDQEHERAIAIYDLIEDNSFSLPNHDGGPYRLIIGQRDKKLALNIHDEAGELIIMHILSMTPFRRIFKDYFLICESYFAAIRTASPTQIEALDMGRRGLHNEGAQLLSERLHGKIDCDFNTARRIFTLITALHWKG
jgi:uncharacterized protein (UPF0262 family)